MKYKLARYFIRITQTEFIAHNTNIVLNIMNIGQTKRKHYRYFTDDLVLHR